MVSQILIGSFLITITIIVQVIFIDIAIKFLTRFGPKISNSEKTIGFALVLVATALWLLAALTIATWIWSVAFMSLNAFESLEESLYFSMVSFTTLGFGDVILPQNLRILSGFVAANGLVLFGLNTAFLIEVMARFRGVNQK